MITVVCLERGTDRILNVSMGTPYQIANSSYYCDIMPTLMISNKEELVAALKTLCNENQYFKICSIRKGVTLQEGHIYH